MVLPLNHDLDSAFVFPPALRHVGAHFPSVRVYAHRTVEDDGVAHGLLGVEVGVRDGAASDHGKNGFAIHSRAASMCC